ncbi:MAG: GNAT family N-acetyltransferase [Bacteroidales bacterium]|nr:GNAT family N-acetyltransferase [Bacteroidales bacterium]
MIQLTPLAESDHPHFAKELFESAFPDEERPPFGEIKKRNNDQFHFLVATLAEDEPVGILTYWTFEDIVYIEHFAIAEELRNQGLGKAVFLNFLSQQTQQIILEVELPNTEEADHRVEFYASMGLIQNTQEYWQPSYKKGENKLALPMIIMSKYELDDDEFEEIKSVLYQNVYHYKG